jgi:simple sugar transport system permease protein
VALGVGILMVAGEFDLSITSTIPMSSFVFVKLLGFGVPLAANLLLTLCVGVVVGLLNGLLVTRTRLPSFILTLGTMLFWKGLLYAASLMMPIGIRAWRLNPSQAFR